MKEHDDSVALAELPVALGAVTGALVGFTPSGEPVVDVSGENAARRLQARTCVLLRPSDIGHAVVLVFDSADPEHPIVIGLIRSPRREQSTEVNVDGETIVLTGRESIVLCCGDASIRLTRDGTVVIRGRHVVTHASGVNRVRGGSVQLN